MTTSRSPVNMTAVYCDTPLPQTPSGQSLLTINAADFAGNAVTSLYTTVSLDGSVISTGFTPFHFTMTDGQTCVVSVSNYGQFTFDHWQDICVVL